jgi:hypothetical protein
LAWAPACFAAAGAAAQALPALILVSERSSVLISSRWLRLLAAGLYLALPNTAEIDVNLDNAQWHLAMAAFLLIVTRPRPGRRTVAFDGVVVLLCGLTGPFGLVLPLVAGPIAAVRRARREVLLFGVSVVTAVSQAICLLDTTRQKSTLGATVHLGIQILGGKVVLGPVLGQRGYSDLLSRTSSQVPFILAAVAGLVFVVLVLLWGTAELRLLLVASGLVLFGSLLDPVVGDQAWRALAAPTTGGRYYFVPVALGVTILIAMLERLPRPMAALGAVYLVAVAFVGVPLDFRYPAFQSFHWARYARAFDRDPPGTVVDIPIPPTGWQVRLIRR